MSICQELTRERPRHPPGVEISRLVVLTAAAASPWRHCRRLPGQQAGDTLCPAKNGCAALRAREINVDRLAVHAGAQCRPLFARGRRGGHVDGAAATQLHVAALGFLLLCFHVARRFGCVSPAIQI